MAKWQLKTVILCIGIPVLPVFTLSLCNNRQEIRFPRLCKEKATKTRFPWIHPSIYSKISGKGRVVKLITVLHQMLRFSTRGEHLHSSTYIQDVGLLYFTLKVKGRFIGPFFGTAAL
jgi:hypothetical protein